MNVDYDPAPRLPVSSGERTFVVVISLAFVGLIAADLAQSFSPNKLGALFVLLFWVPLLVLHELAHALAARWLGWHVSEIVIGFGRELLRFRIGETQLRLRAMPLEGYVVPSPVKIGRARLEQALIYAAGPFSQGLVLLGVVGLVSLLAAGLVLRPLRAVVQQAKAIGAGDAAGSQAIRAPVVAEFDQLSQALASMSSTLRDRNEYIRSFAANVSHEFKTPLSSIQGAVELLRDGAESMAGEQRARFLANIDADARRLTELVKRLLELARADSMAPGGESSGVEAVLREVVERGRAQGVDVALEGAVDGARAAVPPEVLDAAVWQLVSNAAQHGGPGVRVRIGTGASDGRVRIAVKDSGAGISEANRARVFDAFFTTARERGGTGMGLTITRSMLRVFGATLELSPPAGEGGAEFVVTAPRAH